MSLKGSTTAEKIWNYLINKGMTTYGAAGLMGNLKAESNLQPNNLENLCEQRLIENGKAYCTDEQYTEAVDNGTISRSEFLNPLPNKQYGYGLAQWTSPSRKAGLYDLVKSRGVSIADLETQLDWLMSELTTSYTTVLTTLKLATTVRAASDMVLTKFECPADQSESVKQVRAGYGQTYFDDYSKSNGGSALTEQELRRKYADTINEWIGLDRAAGTHKPIIDLYNSHTPLARGYKVTYTDAYCAATVSAAAIKCDLTDIIPTECGCGQQIELFKAQGCWMENDAYIPDIGDIVYYYWADDGVGDCTGWPDHVGVVAKVSGTTLTITEGNMSGKVGQRTITVNARYIRGYGIPDFASKATSTTSSTSNTTTTATKTTATSSTKWTATGTATCTGSNVNVRATANGTIIGQLNKGNRFEVDGIKSGEWVHAKVDKIGVGYVHQNYVQYDSGSTASTNTTSATTTTKVGKCTGNNVNVRSGPGTSYSVLRQLDKGNLFDILGTSGDWTKVNIVGTVGYVYSQYVAVV